MSTSSSHSYFSNTMSSSSSSSQPSYTPSSERSSEDERDPYDEPRIPPVVAPPQPIPVVIPPRGPRTIQTARKRVAIPRRVSFRSDQRDAPEPSRVIEGVPINRAPGMTWAEEQRLRAVTVDVHGCQARISHQSQVITELTELSHLLTNMSSDALSGARIARRIAIRAEIMSIVVVMLLTLLVLWVLMEVYRGGY